ncbi:MAG: SixA phosphatase family protein [Aquaticitalea sp.]
MKTLTLIRHAKSSWEYDFADIDTPLSVRGIQDAKLLSKELLNYNLVPDAIYSSPANRAFTTCQMFMEKLNLEAERLTVVKELYDFGGNQVINFIRKVNDQHSDILIFGHNHAFTSIANDFGDKYIDNIPTCGLVKLRFDVDSWKRINDGRTIMTLFPRDLKS